MKEMVYGGPVEVLEEEAFAGYNYVVGSLSCYPVAYVEIPDGHPCFKKPFSKIPITCHGGLSYGESGQRVFGKKDGYWIGWDYGHCSDYSVFTPTCTGRKWTTAEIVDEVHDVIAQLHKLENA